jgi:hypothetical protein
MLQPAAASDAPPDKEGLGTHGSGSWRAGGRERAWIKWFSSL